MTKWSLSRDPVKPSRIHANRGAASDQGREAITGGEAIPVEGFSDRAPPIVLLLDCSDTD